MKKIKLLALLMGALILNSGFVSAKGSKNAIPMKKNEIELDYSQFGKYLHDGNPDSIEGVYRSADKRYVIALIKNETNSHDFIGVVVSADNPYWKEGEVKFNFKRKDSQVLEGYYYDSKGIAYPITFKIGKSTIDTELIEKVDLVEIEAGSYALL